MSVDDDVPRPPFRCATAARERQDPMIGTAPAAPAYLLIEHPGPWRFDVLTGAGWSAEVTTALTDAVRATRARLLFIRRPGRRPTRSSARRWAVVRVAAGASWGEWEQESDLLAAADALRSAGDLPDASPEPLSLEPLLLVCAHGVHDACCAIRGRPVAAALAERWPEATWECSHVGGDRFAANLVVLPDGTYYGGLDVGSAVPAVAGHLAGRVDVDHLRGCVRWTPVAQVAVAEVHRQRGPFAPDELRPERWTTEGPGHWTVTVLGPGERRDLVEVVAEQRPQAVLTCAAARATAATSYRAVSFSSLVTHQ